MELTHSLTHPSYTRDNIELGTDLFGFGYPDPKSVLSALEEEKMTAQNYERFCKEYEASITSKAREVVDLSDRVASIQHSRRRTPYWFVTINPKPGIELETFHNMIVEFFTLYQVENLMWCYEWGSSGNLHAHLLFDLETDKNWCDRKLKAYFLGCVGNKKHIHVRWVDVSEKAKVESYLRKSTVAKSKSKADNLTKNNRAALGIPDIFTEDHLLVWSEVMAEGSTPDSLVLLN